MPLRATIAFVFVWLMLPHEPDLGAAPAMVAAPAPPACQPRREATCDGMVFQGMIEAIGSLQSLRGDLLLGIDRVRTDMKSHTPSQASRWIAAPRAEAARPRG